ncbi:hypothetical protein BDV98DRAFT_598091 [Pterulicium gracile]|uniref:REJ domain-containing protein n=1 Tax=Pterulicium gracile TaxID=1884261 RepID=A0A5C3Q2B8_9AGAR|nr:hypothetical protein BDV98DRAFT_598091 [Pterula gracilis]
MQSITVPVSPSSVPDDDSDSPGSVISDASQSSSSLEQSISDQPPSPTPSESSSEDDSMSPSSSSSEDSDGPSSSDEPPPPSSSQESSTTREPSSSSEPTASRSRSMSDSMLTEASTSLSRSDVIYTSDGHLYTSIITYTSILPAGSIVPVPIDLIDTNPSSSRPNTGAIAGGVVGGVAFLALSTSAGLWAWRRWRAKRQEREFDGNFDPAVVGVGSPRKSGFGRESGFAAREQGFVGAGEDGDDAENGDGGGGGGAAVVGKRASWRKRLSIAQLRTSKGSGDFDRDEHVEGGTLPRIHLDEDEDDDPYSPTSTHSHSRSPPPTAMSMSERMVTHPSFGPGSGVLYSHASRSSLQGGVSGVSSRSPTRSGSTASFGMAGAPMGMHGTGSGSSSPLVSFAGVRTTSPPLGGGLSPPLSSLPEPRTTSPPSSGVPPTLPSQ